MAGGMMGMAAIGGASDLISSAMTTFGGGAMSYQQSKKLQKRAQRFAQKMYQHRYQWAREDMRAAGLNPILMHSAGPGAAPSAGAGTISAPAPRGVDMIKNLRAAKEMQLLDAQRKLTNAQRGKAVIETDESASRYVLNSMNAHRLKIANRLLATEIPSAKALESYYKSEFGQWTKRWNLAVRDLLTGPVRNALRTK